LIVLFCLIEEWACVYFEWGVDRNQGHVLLLNRGIDCNQILWFIFNGFWGLQLEDRWRVTLLGGCSNMMMANNLVGQRIWGHISNCRLWLYMHVMCLPSMQIWWLVILMTNSRTGMYAKEFKANLIHHFFMKYGCQPYSTYDVQGFFNILLSSCYKISYLHRTGERKGKYNSDDSLTDHMPHNA